MIILSILASIIACIACVKLAKTKNRNPIVWGILAVLFPLPAYLILRFAMKPAVDVAALQAHVQELRATEARLDREVEAERATA